ncbi:homeobox domain-containing protein NDAI_0H00100 [Naumovozyma dairenensis CBS 421]|uniref:Homeobox domain-containing protein n=1 Tax=Naumovozyma dairenensis (strain ATCC 10597 / BCRC 20456 / CBS 421 / NBRC 0211 / NRRL Y-12639) TaxID=1071378 RepID=G0WEH3_NAUDC|nr:hypothetical protein NDAI_0A00670 [Naumovozyma dairenensis CBS 421]XP_003671427.1 hypothetical protein NDAI_0H00100 [Naumovozyma dairenensis CBS 421]CCD22225.1 hypothetical protein NDAI_0A00670 [Naumovozyma dairenensis CBS 421]CCD26184.1 hypothetical protein NDAI_0H00100 [Naumovozyma dairenensis CBS 421]
MLLQDSFNETSQDILNSSLSLFKKSLLLKQVYENYLYYRSRSPISKENKLLLENIFQKKPWLNTKEREFVAKSCGMSALQVRVWFINKRMRTKIK